jgi:hypothetical protein
VKFRKECVDKILSFISESSGGIPLFSYQQKCKYIIESCKVCTGQVEVLDFFQPGEWLKN